MLHFVYILISIGVNMGTKIIEVIVEGGKATAGPPLGPALGPLGVNAGKVVAEINSATADFKNMKVPVKVIVDTSTKEFTIEVGSPPTSELIKKEAGIKKGGGAKEPVADISLEKLVKIAKSKLNTSLGSNLKQVLKEVVGTCKSMAITVNGKNPREVIREIDEGKHDSLIA